MGPVSKDAGLVLKAHLPNTVMAGLDPAIHVYGSRGPLTWMPATNAGMTTGSEAFE